MPAQIEALEQSIRAGEATLSDPDFYRTGAQAIREAVERIEKDRAALTATYARWDELDSRT